VPVGAFAVSIAPAVTLASVKTSAGLLLYRTSTTAGVELFLVHPGGPFWAKKDAGAWSIPKGEFEPGEDPLAAAVREFAEELGSPPPPGPDLELGSLRQSSAKTVTVFARCGDFDAGAISSNTIDIVWPPRSNRTLTIPEVDRAQWWGADEARIKLVKGQVPFVERLLTQLGLTPRDGDPEAVAGGADSVHSNWLSSDKPATQERR
jgi:predicted NUDIX family NTP pyrophosphohydrolase